MLVAALGLMIIGPALWSGWAGDDSFYSALDGTLGADGTTLWQMMYHSFQLWFFENGRFYPGLIVEKYLVFYVFTNLIAYKALLVASTLLVVELFRRCICAYVSRPVANLAALAVLPLLAERGYQDSILAYNAMPQVVAAAMIVSLMTFRRWLVRGEPWMGVVSVCAYAAAALTYEDVYPLFALIPRSRSFWGKAEAEIWRFSAPYIVAAVTLGAFAVFMRAMVHLPAGSLYVTGFAPRDVLRTAAYQISAAFPMSYWLFDPSGIYDRSSVAAFFRNAPVSPAFAMVFAFAAWIAIRSALHERVSLRPLLWIGSMVLVLPALPIALTLKYQHELKLGLGYLPVFFEAFGVATIVAAIVLAIVRRYRSPFVPIAVAGAIALCGAMTQATNVRLVAEGWPSREARISLERELSQGLFWAFPMERPSRY